MGKEGAGLGGTALQRGCWILGGRQGWGGDSGVQRAVTWYGGQAQICVRDPLFHPSLGLWPRTPQVGGSSNPLPAPSGSRV